MESTDKPEPNGDAQSNAQAHGAAVDTDRQKVFETVVSIRLQDGSKSGSAPASSSLGSLILMWVKATRQPQIHLSNIIAGRPSNEALPAEHETVNIMLPETVQAVRLAASPTGFGGEILSFTDADSGVVLEVSLPSSEEVSSAGDVPAMALTTPSMWTKMTRRITMDFIRYWDDQVPAAPPDSEKPGPTLLMHADRGQRSWPPPNHAGLSVRPAERSVLSASAGKGGESEQGNMAVARTMGSSPQWRTGQKGSSVSRSSFPGEPQSGPGGGYGGRGGPGGGYGQSPAGSTFHRGGFGGSGMSNNGSQAGGPFPYGGGRYAGGPKLSAAGSARSVPSVHSSSRSEWVSPVSAPMMAPGLPPGMGMHGGDMYGGGGTRTPPLPGMGGAGRTGAQVQMAALSTLDGMIHQRASQLAQLEAQLQQRSVPGGGGHSPNNGFVAAAVSLSSASSSPLQQQPTRQYVVMPAYPSQGAVSQGMAMGMPQPAHMAYMSHDPRLSYGAYTVAPGVDPMGGPGGQQGASYWMDQGQGMMMYGRPAQQVATGIAMHQLGAGEGGR